MTKLEANRPSTSTGAYHQSLSNTAGPHHSTQYGGAGNLSVAQNSADLFQKLINSN